INVLGHIDSFLRKCVRARKTGGADMGEFYGLGAEMAMSGCLQRELTESLHAVKFKEHPKALSRNCSHD
ncbi:MAG TPA: hypothetical protein VE988_08295, partial [Gemmataceae bacterium]|nr:hypothetical protein [Gemmataceae bacterium]